VPAIAYIFIKIKKMITSAVPKLPFINKQETIDYYVNQLGFTLQSDYGEYLIMQLDNAELHFFSYPALKPANSDFMVYLRIDSGIGDLFQEFQTQNITIHPNGKLDLKAWKQLEFSITNPNGTLLTFGQAKS
jgi:hypothetical protein